MSDMTIELQELIASSVRGKALVDIVKFDDVSFTTPLYLCGQLNNGTPFTFESSEKTVTYAPMLLSKASSGRTMLDTRTLSLSLVNDLVYEYESLIPYEQLTKPTVSVMQYISDVDGNLTGIQSGPFNYFANGIGYDADNCSINLSTYPVNDSMTGNTINITDFPGLSLL